MKAKWCLLAWGLALFAACESGPAVQKCDETLSLRKECVTDAAKPLPAAVYSTLAAGEAKKLDRAYPTSPPLIPHSIADMPIQAEMNACLMCHGAGVPDFPPIPPSHKKTALTSQPKTGMLASQVVGYAASETADPARWQCLTCHVPQATNLQPLVANQF